MSVIAGVLEAAQWAAAIRNACGYAPICSPSGTRARECPKFEVAVSFLASAVEIGCSGQVNLR
jgi:hypothetical protein